MAGKHVFISYRGDNLDFVKALVQKFHAAGLPTWVDRLGGINPGDKWVTTIQAGVNEAAALVAVMTPSYTTRPWTRRELQRAEFLDLPIFPALLEKVETPDWPIEIQDSQWVDFRGWEDAALFDKRAQTLVDEIKAKTGITVDATVGDQPIAETGVQAPPARIDEQVAALRAEKTADLPDFKVRKRQRLQRRIDAHQEELDAVTAEILMVTNPVTAVRLERMVDDLEAKIAKLNEEIQAL